METITALFSVTSAHSAKPSPCSHPRPIWSVTLDRRRLPHPKQSGRAAWL